ncbi:unnamed protein product [Discosporangium mesarthrocarpum]
MTDMAPSNVPPPTATEGVRTLRSLSCIRSRSRVILEAAKEDRLSHFRVNLTKVEEVAAFVQELMDKDYPSYEDVPYHSRWRHFEVGGVNRVAKLRAGWDCDPREAARRMIDLVTTSVLLDAGAGDHWRYVEPGTGMVASRSEGLGVASFHMFAGGAFSSDPANPQQANSVGLRKLDDGAVRKAFQVEDSNPLVGCDGRTRVLQRLGVAIEEHPEYFEVGGVFRPGNMVDYLTGQADANTKEISISKVWEVVMYGYESMWPGGRTVVDGRGMGDVWKHSALPNDGSGWSQLVPFHKLSQWMTYSLMEPLKDAGLRLTETHLMTGLPEYRNGGLLLDLGLLETKYEAVTGEAHAPEEEVIVEWRALTVSLLDEVASTLRRRLGKSEEEFPLVKMLEGGTWKAGRVTAKKLRPSSGAPPIQIISDGTVF